MTFEEYRQLDATAMAELVKTKQVKPEELLAAARQRTEAVNPKINAVVTPLYEEATQQLQQLDPEARFAGVPFLLKDLDVQLKGTRYTCGSRLLQHYVSTENSEVTNRILRGGLVIFGKTNTPEFGLTPYTEGALLGICRNPWSTAHTAGGSSGGAAAAVAAGIVPMAFASDGGGSIRIPASCCGLFGIKPSRGRITNGPQYGELWSGAVSSGIISRTVRDAAAYTDLVSGSLAGDPYAIAAPPLPYAEAIRQSPLKLKIGYSHQLPEGLSAPVDEENIRAIAHTVQLLRAAGHEVSEVPLPFTHQLNADLLYTLVLGELSATLDYTAAQLGRKPRASDVEPNTWLLYRLGKSFSANAFALARLKWNEVNRTMAGFFGQYDLLLTPTLGRRPFTIGALQTSKLEDLLLRLLNALGISSVVRYTGLIEKIAEQTFSWIPYPALANITGLPAMTVPLHWSSEGLPVGVMFTGRMGDEATLFRLAAALEQAQPWFNRVPEI